jgi:xanthine dehydrogenase/oxidase
MQPATAPLAPGACSAGVELVVSDSKDKISKSEYDVSAAKLKDGIYAALPFPEELKTLSLSPTALVIKGKAVTWHSPVTLKALLSLKQQHPSAKLIVGNTEVGIETKFKHLYYATQVGITRVPELNTCGLNEAGTHLVIGGATTLTTMLGVIKSVVSERKGTAQVGNQDEQLLLF